MLPWKQPTQSMAFVFEMNLRLEVVNINEITHVCLHLTLKSKYTKFLNRSVQPGWLNQYELATI